MSVLWQIFIFSFRPRNSPYPTWGTQTGLGRCRARAGEPFGEVRVLVIFIFIIIFVIIINIIVIIIITLGEVKGET